MANIRQSIVIRTDLQFKPGLLAAQVAHLSMEFMRAIWKENNWRELIHEETFSAAAQDWLKAPYLFVHGVPNQEALSHFINLAEQKTIPYKIWKDTVFLDVSEKQRIVVADCIIGAAFGPEDSDRIKEVLGDLPLLS